MPKRSRASVPAVWGVAAVGYTMFHVNPPRAPGTQRHSLQFEWVVRAFHVNPDVVYAGTTAGAHRSRTGCRAHTGSPGGVRPSVRRTVISPTASARARPLGAVRAAATRREPVSLRSAGRESRQGAFGAAASRGKWHASPSSTPHRYRSRAGRDPPPTGTNAIEVGVPLPSPGLVGGVDHRPLPRVPHPSCRVSVGEAGPEVPPGVRVPTPNRRPMRHHRRLSPSGGA
ncbi:hypothetical protein SAMN05444583_1283 [Rhodococcus maanshanensis]|uniref:Uncharacterized protein n=1 Tax=Rhodococcus maanshanensis TaxID=183556 RepID=A0A1H7WNF3_9NOCA|nr:hypothetical protein SAMN05444583_1283 [Rhodococcus maanshanensis]